MGMKWRSSVLLLLCTIGACSSFSALIKQPPVSAPNIKLRAHLFSSEVVEGQGALDFLPPRWQQPASYVAWTCAGVGLVMLIRPFAAVVLSTFVISFIAQSFISNSQKLLLMAPARLQVETRGLEVRRWLVLTFYVGLVSVITTLIVGTVPRLVADSQYLLAVSRSDDPYVFVANALRNLLGDDVIGKLETFLLWRDTGGVASAGKSLTWSDARSSRFVALVSAQLKGPVQAYAENVVAVTRDVVASVAKGLLQGVVSLLFSFLIMWDLPTVSAGIQSLRQSKRAWVRSVYAQVAPRCCSFASIMGRSFEAQALIAIVNTLLTTAGMVALGLPGVVFLGLFVLLCSFIPVAGLVLSTIPMMLVALSEYGVASAALVLLMVAVVHLVEAYVANPQIYSSLLELHPILVLSALYVAEHFFGPKGMLLAVPFAEYIIEDVVMGRVEDGDGRAKGGGDGDAEDGLGLLLPQMDQ